MASDEELLLNTLKELREDDLKEFQWRLKNDHECIPECEMENADRLKTVSKMKACFGPKEAVKITVDTLRKMNQNDLAGKLENKHKRADRAPVQRSQPGAGGVHVRAEGGARVNAPVMTGNTFTGSVHFYN